MIKEATQLLKDLVCINTVNPPGNEIEIVEFIKPILEAEGIEVKVFEPELKRGNLWARVKGNGDCLPLLLVAHTDVVSAANAGWQSDPFKAVEKDGYLYGRGVMDDKGMAALCVVVMKYLKKNKVRLNRDVILLLAADEETGSEKGLKWMIDHHPDLLKAEAALNEGGCVILEDGKPAYTLVQNYEKLYMDVVLKAYGTAGHSAAPTSDNAVIKISRAVLKLGTHRFPLSFNPVTKAYIEGLSGIENHPLAKDFKILLQGESTPGYKESSDRISEVSEYNSRLRTTCVPTIIRAGVKQNVIPSEVEASLNCRVLPQDNPEDIIKIINEVVDDPHVKVVQTRPDVVEEPCLSPFDGAFFESVKRTLSNMVPDIPVIPFMSTGCTDSRRLRRLGIDTYGLLPMPLSLKDKSRMHGDNERIPLDSVGFGLKFLYNLVCDFTSC